MSYASCGATPSSGMAVPGFTCCVFMIHSARLACVLASVPAISLRLPMPASGGPT